MEKKVVFDIYLQMIMSAIRIINIALRFSVYRKNRLCLIIGCALIYSCSEPQETAKGSRVVVMTTELVNDPEVFRIYDSLHSKEGVWPALKKANEASGIQEISIYRFGNRLVMMFSVPADADMRKVDSLYVAADPKVKVWGELMAGYQRALPGLDSSQKWVEMKRIHHYVNGHYTE